MPAETTCDNLYAALWNIASELRHYEISFERYPSEKTYASMLARRGKLDKFLTSHPAPLPPSPDLKGAFP